MLNSLRKIIDAVIEFAGILTNILLLILVAVIAYNVIGRYVFNASSIGLEELAWHLYSAIFLIGFSYALKYDGHVRVDIIYENISIKKRAIIDIIGTFVFLIPFCYVVAVYGWDFTREAFVLNEGSQDPGGLPYRFIAKGLIPLSAVLLFLASISFLLKKIDILKEHSNNNETSK